VSTGTVASMQDSDDTPPNYRRNCYLYIRCVSTGTVASMQDSQDTQ
jgi:hypothetical protein